jgi:purine-binding chemotaxis protein CheW
MRALLIPLGDDVYAIAMDRVREVVADPIATRLPTGPPSVLGVFNLHGEIVPLFDTATLLGLGGGGRAPFAVVVDSPLGPAGLSATAAPESANLGAALATTDAASPSALYGVDDRIVTLVDVEWMLAPERTSGRAA